MDGTLLTEALDDLDRLAGELVWWIGDDCRLAVGAGAVRVPAGSLASGRVCLDTGIGVIERLGGRDAVLALLPRGVVDALHRRFPRVRWAVADVAPTPATPRPQPRARAS